jgi:Na+-driven multidrug efflux pump
VVTANTVREIALERSNLIGTNSTDMTGQENSSQQKILRVALPVSLEAVFQASLGFVDQVIVGILGAIAVAAVGLSNSI